MILGSLIQVMSFRHVSDIESLCSLYGLFLQYFMQQFLKIIQ